MGELRAYVVSPEALRTVLTGGATRRADVVEAVRRVLDPPPPPNPLGPVFVRLPGAPVVRADDPSSADLDRLLGGEPVQAGRAAATWRLVEAAAAALATGTVRTASERPAGLQPLGLALPELMDATAGTWTAAQASAVAGLRDLVADGAPAVVVFWSAAAGRGPTG